MNRQIAASRRGAALVAFVTALMVIGTMTLTVLQMTAVGAQSHLAHYRSNGAFYAAESGIEMSMREVNQSSDIDSDGTIGSISNNGNAADDPTLVSGSFSVSVSAKVYTATGTWLNYKRSLEATTE